MKMLLVCILVVICNVASVSFANDTAPTISSVSVSPETSAAGDMISVTVQAQDDIGVSSVTADSVPLQLVNNIWQGYITANSTNGLHNVTVIATDTSGNTSSNTGSCYTTLPIVGISNSGATSETAKSSASRFLFKVWGRATYVDASHFDVDDGSRHSVHVNLPRHIVRTGDYVTARGNLRYTQSSTYIDASDYDIIEFASGNKITAPDLILGNHLQLPCVATLGHPTVSVTLTSLDPGRLLLGTSSDATPRNSISATTSNYCYYTIFGLADSGTARIAAVSSDGQRGLLKVKLAPTGFVFYSAFGYPFDANGSININRYGGNGPIYIQCAILDPLTHTAVDLGCLGYGLPDVSVAFNNSNPSAAVITPNPVILQGYVSPNTVIYYNATIQPVDFGTTVLSLITPPGFTTPSEKQQVTLNIIEPSITKSSSNPMVGRNLQIKRYVCFQKGPAPQADVTLSVDDSSIATISTDPALEGSGSITINGAKNGSTSYYVQGRNIGTTTLTISSPGYKSATETITVAPSGFVLGSSSITTNKYASNTIITIKSARLNPDSLEISEYQNLRGGLSINVPISTSDPTVGVAAPSSVAISANATQAYTAFDPVDVGTCILSLGTPDGFQTPSEKQQLTATVNTPKIIIRSSSNVGCNLQATWSFSLESTPPTPVDVSVSVDDSSIAMVSSASTSKGSTSIAFSGVGTTSTNVFYVQGLAVGETNIRITAPGYSDTVMHLQVFPSGFVFMTSDISTTTLSANTPLTVTCAFYDPQYYGGMVYQQIRPGIAPVSVTLQSSDVLVGNITVNPLIFTSGSSNISSAFHPLAEGTCTVSLIQPDGFQTPDNGRISIPVAVRKPNITFYAACNTYVGVNLQTKHIWNLEKAPLSPVDITVTVGDSSIATVSTNPDDSGTGSVKISGISSTSEFSYYLQGRKQGTTTLTLSAPGYADSVINNVEVQQSGFVFGELGSITVPMSAGTRQISVYSGTGYWADEQPIRGGLGRTYVPVYCSNTFVGTITGSPVMFYQYLYNSCITFVPKAIGTCEIWLSPPNGWSAFPGYDRLTVTVTP